MISNILEVNNYLQIDDKDREIITLLSNDPNASHSDIAKHIHLSQPSVGSRIRKLTQKKLLQKVYGTNFKGSEIIIGKIDVDIKDPTDLLNFLRNDKRVLNAFINMGEYNLTIFCHEFNLKKIEAFVNEVRKFNCKVELNIVSNFLRDFVLPTDLSTL